jgi:AraC-like DNA-binding protein
MRRIHPTTWRCLVTAVPPDSMFLFAPPYAGFTRLEELGGVADGAGRRGSILLWSIGPAFASAIHEVASRQPGLALISILPPAPTLNELPELYRHVEACRPSIVLPHHVPRPDDLRTLLLRGPEDIPGEVTDYLTWRNPDIDSEARMLARRTLHLSENLRSVTGLARALYISRRALGRKFLSLGLPVPSHLLHFGRILRAYVRAQRDALPLATVARDLGYPDAFALSNQMKRLVGVRPSRARDRLGWEWLVESWLVNEANPSRKDNRSAPLGLRGVHARGGIRRPTDGSAPKGA